MKLKHAMLVVCAAFASANAQDIYTMEKMTSEDLNGTARFVGMGGAMSALGADMSTMSTNPAGIGLFRRADIATSLSIDALAKGEKFDDHGKSRVSYDQIGIVYPFRMNTGAMRYFNVGFNYHKRKNFHSLVGADQILNGASQTWEMSDASSFWGGADKGTPLAVAGYQTMLYEPLGTKDESGYDQYAVYGATKNAYRKWTTGGIQQYDFNMSTNISDRYYFGLTIGVYNINVDSYSEYWENLVDNQNHSTYAGEYLLRNNRSINGSGVDFKFGTIIYPIEGSSFRLGLSISTPVWYSLTENCTSYVNSDMQGLYDGVADNQGNLLYEGSHKGKYDYRTEVGDHDYNIHTPWKFNISAAGTVGDYLALDAEYEYSDYSATKLTYDNVDDDWGWGENETKDRELNRQAGKFLKGVSTVRLGAEAKLDYGLSLRLGYNYVSSPFAGNAMQNQFINSASLDYSTSTNYMNLSDINRYTVGLGYKAKHFYADFAYQYQKQSGDFYAFTTQQGNSSNENDAPCTKLKLNKSRFLLTLGYKF